MKFATKGLLLVSTLLFASHGYAACEAGIKTVFQCTATNNKQIEVCDAGKTINYSFGKHGKKPELALSVPRDQATTFQWHGIGRYINYSVSIPNGSYTYTVYTSIDKLEENEAKGFEAGVMVEKSDEHLVTVICRDTTVVEALEGIDLRPSED